MISVILSSCWEHYTDRVNCATFCSKFNECRNFLHHHTFTPVALWLKFLTLSQSLQKSKNRAMFEAILKVVTTFGCVISLWRHTFV